MIQSCWPVKTFDRLAAGMWPKVPTRGHRQPSLDKSPVIVYLNAIELAPLATLEPISVTQMTSLIHKLTVVLTIVSVVVVFIAPDIDLPETTLRAKQIVCPVFAAIACVSVGSFFAAAPLLWLQKREPLVVHRNVDNESFSRTFLC